MAGGLITRPLVPEADVLKYARCAGTSGNGLPHAWVHKNGVLRTVCGLGGMTPAGVGQKRRRGRMCLRCSTQIIFEVLQPAAHQMVAPVAVSA